MRRRLDQLISKMVRIACSVVTTISSDSRIEKLLPVEKTTVNQDISMGRTTTVAQTADSFNKSALILVRIGLRQSFH